MSHGRTAARTALLATLLTVLLAGCGEGEPPSHSTGHRKIVVDAGEEFDLTVPYNASTGERWGITTPAPDPSVVRTRGRRFAHDTPVQPGSGGTLHLRFTARKRGTTRIVLLHCLVHACDGPVDSPSPAAPSPSTMSLAPLTPRPERITWTVTVR
ncbi:protease inhibitor I42 family protein [Streptomyces sp. NPDC059740]|uniref:protease inhibitor I42 family protein n=1 Tax=Streptomyces sp. NPDC059740 TaxID=3346926 RepID=UPI00364BE11C